MMHKDLVRQRRRKILRRNSCSETEADAGNTLDEASTLAFVFDVTGSMYDDLVQVIEGASKILETSLNRPKKPLYNFALVPFHDPEIGPVTITTDPEKFQNELKELYVQGGGDCPEMSVGAIKIALEISLPGSFVYVFTDARSKDYQLANDVLQLIQQKQSQVVFVLTGDCDDRTHVGYKVYEEIASTSSGQVFHLDKKQVNEVLKWVEEAVQASKVHLISTDHLNGASYTWDIPFDPSLKEVTVSLSGPSPDIELYDPLGKQVKSENGLNELLNIYNSAKVLNIKEPLSGMWKIKTSSNGRHSVRITGVSTIDFRAGFSNKPTLDFSKTSSRPIQGIPTYVLLNTTGISHPARIDRLELLSISGDLLETIPVKYYPKRTPYEIWNVTEFIPPNEPFFLKITGYDKDNFLFQRVSSVSFSNIIPGAPKVSMPKVTPGYYQQPGRILCYVESLLPVTVRFSKNGFRIGIEQKFRDSVNASWEIANVSIADEGFYECTATSNAGSARAQTFLDVNEPPPVIRPPNNVTVTIGKGTFLSCDILSTVRYNLTWVRNNVDLKYADISRFRILHNNSVEIKSVTIDDAGEYNCYASNEGGTAIATVILTVQELIQRLMNFQPKYITFTKGREIKLKCSATGYPTPHIVWTHNDMFIRFSSRYVLSHDGTFIIKNSMEKDSGTYTCLATNAAGTDQQTSDVVYIEAPQITVAKKEMLVEFGAESKMECQTTGVPKPDVYWYKGDIQIENSSMITIDSQSGIIKIKNTQYSDAGHYVCTATNDAGTASGKVILDVGSSPVFIETPSDVSKDIGSDVTLSCKAAGRPEPRIKWRRLNDTSPSQKPLIHQFNNQQKVATLHIKNLWVGDEGIYICEAENQFGKIQSQAAITITGLVVPVIGESPAVVSVIEGNQVTLPCVLLAGNPFPERHWVKNNIVLVSNPYVSVRTDGSLHLERVLLNDGGDYLCSVTNVAGTSIRITTLNVYVSPVIQHGPQIFSTIEGNPVSLPCKANGVPKPVITWKRKGDSIVPNNDTFLIDSEGSLQLSSPGGEDSGEYSCNAVNAAGYAARKVQLTVYVKPRISNPDALHPNGSHKHLIEISVKAGDDIVLPCEVSSTPPPFITWAKETQLISPYSQRHNILPSGSMKLFEARVSDGGMYTCVATNIAGNITQFVKLNVYVPPKIQRGPKVIRGKVGHPFEITCISHGIPPPKTTWLKDWQKLEPLQDPPDNLLRVESAKISDAGKYTCIVSNIIGQDSVNVTVEIHAPPTLSDLEPPYNNPFQERVSKQQISFPCPAKGNPKPIIKWLRNNKELTGGEPGINIIEGGTMLIIDSLTPYDNGEYTCVAINEAGLTERKYSLKVHDPPVIRDREKLTNVSVLLSHDTTLFCEASGSPLPLIVWYKGDTQVVENSDIQILEKGKILKFLKTSMNDAGLYKCKATNIAGDSEKQFFVDLLDPPTIAGSGLVSDVTVNAGLAGYLECRVSGVPFPLIQWFKDNRAISPGDTNIKILERSQLLQIKNSHLSDSGHYKCIATNTAGSQIKQFKLTVNIPPSIKDGNSTTELTFTEGNEINLECDARGMPTPTLTWHKDGQAIHPISHVLYKDQGKYLRILESQITDSGNYICHATNLAGSAEKIYLVDIYVPATIIGHSSKIEAKKVTVGNSLLLDCNAVGHPQPLLTWLKDGVPVEINNNVRIEYNGKKLEIKNAEESDHGQYSCVATNIAGEAEIKYKVSVLVPPSIEDAQDSEDHTVIAKSPVELECNVFGTPLPTISWLKNGIPVEINSGLLIQSNGQKLLIPSAEFSDRGNYQCVAKNEAGVSRKQFTVNVHVRPIIKPMASQISVLMHKSTSLQCVASGVPVPIITWLKDGVPFNAAKDNIKMESSGRAHSIKFEKTLLEDAGKYTCVATNAAGETEQSMWLNIYEPPKIKNSGDILHETVHGGHSVILECNAVGNPAPEITWFKGNAQLLISGEVTLVDGRHIQIGNAQIFDSGVYRCVATNAAGEAELTYMLEVHVPPSIFGESGVVSVIVNNSVRLECEATGFPYPGLTWLKDGSPVSSFIDGIQIISGGRVLELKNAQIGDTGRYTCVAVNAAGEQQKDFDLSVYVPPNIMGEEQNMSTLLGETLVLRCQSNAIPPPVLTWLKDWKPLTMRPGVSISEDGSVLKVEGAQVKDSGRYSCEAVNVAGKTEKNYNVNILVPPSIQGSSDESEVTVIEGSLISLLCDSSGIPPPALTWKKNGTLLTADSSGRVRFLSGGRHLQITAAEKSDTASYTCTASNTAGSVVKKYNVKVHVRPRISESGNFATEVVVIYGNDVTLECQSTGDPQPLLTWLKDGVPLINGDGVNILSNGRLLRLENAQLANTGHYVCVAINVAGQSDRKYNLKVFVPPRFPEDVKKHENVSVLERNPVTLTCGMSGIPPPTITWYKDGHPITQNHSPVIMSGGMVLRFSHASISDAGRYTCIVSNAAGEDKKIFDLDILVPPKLFGKLLEDIKVKENDGVTLSCEAVGNPVPQVTWQKDGLPLLEDTNHQISLGGQHLHITNTTITDSGRYTCIVSNSAGDKSKSFSLSVLVSPTISAANLDGSPEDVSVILHSSLSLNCDVHSHPPAMITWHKDGHEIQSKDNIRILPGGRMLQIIRAQEDHTGRYKCVATNEAGEAIHQYELKVYIPPQINKGDISGTGQFSKEVKARENSNFSLHCDVKAFPLATVTWYKDGQLLDPESPLTIIKENTLHVEESQLSDTGRYTCVARNLAGEDEMDFDVIIQVPPNFPKLSGIWLSSDSNIMNQNGENKEVVLNNPLSLYCETNAVPPPTITWYKNGHLLTSNGKAFILPGGHILQIARAQEEDAGTYTCVAVNEAGKDSIHYHVNVLLPPMFEDDNLLEDITALVNDTVLLNCSVKGEPIPTIAWQKDRQQIEKAEQYQYFLSGRSLQIKSAQLMDTGRYTCIVENGAGSAQKSFNLNIYVPPSIIGSSFENVTVVENNLISLICEVTGFPPPTINWQKNGEFLSQSNHLSIVPGGRILQILQTKLSDAGEYKCVAINQAGESRKTILLNVYAPPSIVANSRDSSTEINARVTSSVMLDCESNAFPPPTVQWYKNGLLITESDNHEALDGGQTLSIKHAQVSNTGEYECVATNIVGQDNKKIYVNVHVPPSIQGPSEEYHNGIIQNTVTLLCDAYGIPTPTIKWLKDGHQISQTDSLEVQFLSGGSKLKMSRAQLTDSGTYTCFASNTEGTAQKNFILTIQVPPSIIGSGMSNEVNVVPGEDVQLVCKADGTPVPVIHWIKDGKHINNDDYQGIRVSEDGQNLIISKIKITDIGKYTCVATNSAGEDDRIFNVNVYVAPRIAENNGNELTAILDTSINIECIASGSPPPQINWLKNGLPLPVSSHIRLQSAGQVFRISRVQKSDAGSYTCVASNRAGVDKKDYNLEVYVPPIMAESDITQQLTVVKGNPSTLKCFVDGSPIPQLSWVKDGKPLNQRYLSNLQSNNTVLHLLNTEMDDLGRYTCIASNEAGSVSKHFILNVIEPPHINGSENTEELSVVVNKQLDVFCYTMGFPPPIITWLKDGHPLSQTENVHLLKGGQILRITSAQEVNIGRYTCLASNRAGDAKKEFSIDVHMPPNIAGSSGLHNITALLKKQIALECKSDALPLPKITWLKDGVSLTPNSRVRVLSNGRYLQIDHAEVTDTARYTCVASNIVGKTTREFMLNVYVPPSIKEGPHVVTTFVNEPATLDCVTTGIPSPRISWRKDGTILPGNSSRHFISDLGSLNILTANITDSGQYFCLATNTAGSEQRQIDLLVYAPPSILSGSTNITTMVNFQTTLPCEVSGTPTPKVEWTKNGRLINKDLNQNVYRFLSSGSLVITSPTIEDTGIYACLASSDAGEDEIAVFLSVQVPPSIADEVTNIFVTKLSPALLPCTVSGVPHPSIHWLKDGVRLPARGTTHRILSSGSIEIPSSELNHAGHYTCSAVNEVGSAQIHINLHVQEVPVIRSQADYLEVTLNSPVTLSCDASGVPEPTVTWQKEGTSIKTGFGHTILPNGSIHIEKATQDDVGTYTCIAQNAAGTALGKIKLKVHVPPEIKPHLTKYVIAVDKSITMLCEATGNPTPEIMWYKNGASLATSAGQRIVGTGALQIAFAQPDDGGLYTCIAENIAGTVNSTMTLSVLMPPRILKINKELSVINGSRIKLLCTAQGIPAPVITWEKNNVPVSETYGKYTLLTSGELILHNAERTDIGSYVCTARNVAGEDSHTISLIVNFKPYFTELPTNVSLNEGDTLRLSCQAAGSPSPRITWSFKNKTLSSRWGHSTQQSDLMIENVLREDSGAYTCTAENTVSSIFTTAHVFVREPPVLIGVHHANQSVPLGGNIVLKCIVKGNPSPRIQWTKNGNDILLSRRIQQFSNGSLSISNAISEDAGDYSCIATNDAGVMEHTVRLIPQRLPVITINPVDTAVDAGATMVLNCQAEGEPSPHISWSRHTHPFTDDRRITVLSNNSLQILSARKEDTSVYECKATNIMGFTTVKATFTVRVNGEFSVWLPWQACSVSCGLGVQKRMRLCNNPAPANGGLNCHGAETETRSCQNKPCPVDGNWSVWTTWEECSKSCGVGKKTRLRVCNDPPAQGGGKTCEGKAVDVATCNVTPCPVDGLWSPWFSWGPCSKTCGKGTQTRRRLCNNPSPSFDGLPCEGQDIQMQICNDQHCPVDGKWSVWGSWTSCSLSCGGGIRQRTRDCSNPTPQYGGHTCEGNALENEVCNGDLCPIHGNWGSWSAWGTCSRTCSGGQMRRYRACDNPAPLHSGRACTGTDTEIRKCNTDLCPVDGNWGPWEAWSTCSASCGGGEQLRTRQCNHPINMPRAWPCPGDAMQILQCNKQACPGGPQHVKGNLFGNINGVEFGIALLNGTITSSPDAKAKNIQATITNIPKSLGPSMRNLISILNPIYWTVAEEIGEAVNGFTLTGGAFKGESQVEFATGEILRITHTARGVDSDGSLVVDTAVKGHVLQLQGSADVSVKDYTEDYIQTGPGQLYAHSTRMFSLDGLSVPYAWNHTIGFDEDHRKMPFVIETLRVFSIEADYDPLEESLKFQIKSSISTGDLSNQCPSGFSFDASGFFCADDDECAGHSPCSHLCHNIMGGYYCSCPKGLIITEDGKTCNDVDECSLEESPCRKNQECTNTIGSYMCTVKCGAGFRAASNGLTCQDINECQESVPCHQRCFNSIGSFHCGCDLGYQLKGKRCFDVNECRQGACRRDQLCKNTRGSYKCIDLCPSGLTRADNGSCVDINECREITQPCISNQICENTHGSYHCVCPRGYKSEGAGKPCVDINECVKQDVCQHECKNVLGSYQCLCPPGYQLMANGRTCQDIDECLEQNIQCGANRMCFNMRGSHQCMDTPCPPNYVRDSVSGYCLKNCAANDLECALSPYALQYKLVALPFDIAANQDLIRLVAYTQDGILHPRTTFLIIDEDPLLPFSIREENMKGVVFTIRPLTKPETYRMKVKALSYSIDRTIEYQTAFIVYISVSPYPY
ncbi:hemicentin-1 isoform X2 [Pelobates cultripes]|uniref:Cell adhesion molecule-related/down-regulated by oncogenes n=2 Tax=Pelobates cultripes TaxID=61616 RepID=A0AAD1WKF5_PELCU|nr:hemicentin-1 isoform X2 [Pelobates cultripes]